MTLPKHFDHNLAYVTTCQYADAFIRSTRNFNNYNQRLFDKLDEKLTIYVQSYPVSTIFPLIKKLQSKVHTIIESGLSNYWISSSTTDVSKATFKSKQIVLDFGDMKIPFIILSSGLLISFFVFLLEKLIVKIKDKIQICCALFVVV